MEADVDVFAAAGEAGAVLLANLDELVPGGAVELGFFGGEVAGAEEVVDLGAGEAGFEVVDIGAKSGLIACLALFEERGLVLSGVGPGEGGEDQEGEDGQGSNFHREKGEFCKARVEGLMLDCQLRVALGWTGTGQALAKDR